jgi:hypothetical protein
MPSPPVLSPQWIRCSRFEALPANGGAITAENLSGRAGIRIAFDIVREISGEPNQATITVYNLARDTRARLEGLRGLLAPVPVKWSLSGLLASDESRGYTGPDAITVEKDPPPGTELPPSAPAASKLYGYAYVRFYAGYGGKVGQICEGTMLVPRSTRVDATTWATVLKIGDGSLGAAKAQANLSFPVGTEILTVIRHLLRLIGVGTGNLSPETWARVLGQGIKRSANPYVVSSKLAWPYTPSGASAWRDLETLLRLSNVGWVIDMGQFYLLEADGYLLGEVVDLGRPLKVEDLGNGTWRGTFLLNKSVRPGIRVTLDKTGFAGPYIARRVQHTGDTHGGAFHSIVDFAPIDPLGLGLDFL